MAKEEAVKVDVKEEIIKTFKGDRTLSVVYTKGEEYSFSPSMEGNKDWKKCSREEFIPVVEKEEKAEKKKTTKK